LDNANNLLSTLPPDTYYVNGYCLSNTGKTSGPITSKNHLVVLTSGTTSTSTVVDRYIKLQILFEKYSTGSYYPAGWNPKTFEALLIAIAQRQSNLGYANGGYDTTWLMEYGWINGARDLQYQGQDTQVKNAAIALRSALNYAPTIATYQACNDKNKYTTNKGVDPTSDSLLKCVLSVYMTGINRATSIQGAEAADEVISLMVAWKSYLATGATSPSLQ
jgi:hypothetical protein